MTSEWIFRKVGESIDDRKNDWMAHYLMNVAVIWSATHYQLNDWVN